MIRFLGRNLNYFKTNGSYYFKRFQGLIATYEITYKMCIDKYYKVTGTYVFSVGSCTYCKDGKYLSFLTKDAADQYIRDFKYSAYSSQLRNFDNPEELKLLSRSYFSTDCGCYHITSQPQNSENKIKDLLMMTEYAMSEFSDEYYVNSIDYKKKILQYFKQKIQEKLDSCSETDSIRQEFISILEKLNKDLNQLILGSLSNVDIEKDSSEVKEVSAKAQESPTPSKTVSSEFDGILNDIYDLIVNEFILGDYENCLEMIEKTEQAIYNRTKPWIKKNLKDIHTLLGKISWIKLRILNEQN
jgi:hypothetical protein